ncbi:pyridoxal-dependent decarboxylase conserved domain protein [Aspergillus karnatakaensis]|uniref:pyridoxal phosphate-dependent decarboxylase family protein n=1 Tax=Aspergillus karnatakaensis TaxID=1810916 RepID=UPI003CCD744F
MTSYGDITHQAISSYFIGPEAENLDEFKTNIANILNELENARKRYYPQPPDKKFIPPSIRHTPEFTRLTTKFRTIIANTARLLGQKSVPFWSPRYQGHMCTDLSMVSLLGYFMTMLYNPNNVAVEASPFSTAAEILVGEQICGLLGYGVKMGLGNGLGAGSGRGGQGPTGWAHVTSGGTVANLESIWVARNLKFYPLSLYLAITEGQLQFAREGFMVRSCAGEEKNFADMSTWELLNLLPETVLDLPKMLNDQYGVSPTYIENALDRYNIQTTGKGKLENAFDIKTPCRYLLTNTRHYSWPKGGAITGIGSENMIGIQVDAEARVDLVDLVSNLDHCLRNQIAVYAVVAVIGSTEEGAVDRLSEILRIRRRFQARGLSFLVHADAAWGGYFAAMLPRDLKQGVQKDEEPVVSDQGQGFVPDMGLKVQTQEDLLALKYADSITIDPHKSGYIPYPAGALAYRDERMRSLVTWTAPMIDRGSLENIGVYGVEGSKPGAAAMAIWLANECIGLDQNGYGALLSEATFTCTRLAAHWAAMTTKDDSFTCVALNRLPSEVNGGDVEAEKRFIREQILSKSNHEIVANDPKTHTMTLLRALGSDLNINAFALNWRYEDGRLNDDIEEANFLMLRVVKELSVSSINEDPSKKEFFLTSTEFGHEEYGNCAEVFMDRLGIARSKQGLMVLRNVVMSPFLTEHELIERLVGRFRKVVEEAVQVCRDRNAIKPDIHRFYVQGTNEIFFIYRPRFQEARFRRQLILKGTFNQAGFEAYIRAKARGRVVYLNTSKETCLEALLNQVNNHGEATFQGNLVNGDENTLSSITVSITQIIKNRCLNARNREPHYPQTYTPFYLYGSPSQAHISHILLKSPNIELGAASVQLSLDHPLEESELARGAIMCLTGIPEAPMQPFETINNKTDFFFRPGQKFKVKIWRDLKRAEESGPNLLPGSVEGFGPEIASGEVTLRGEVLVDAESVNVDSSKPRTEEEGEAWRGLFKSLETVQVDVKELNGGLHGDLCRDTWDGKSDEIL